MTPIIFAIACFNPNAFTDGATFVCNGHHEEGAITLEGVPTPSVTTVEGRRARKALMDVIPEKQTIWCGVVAAGPLGRGTGSLSANCLTAPISRQRH